MINNFETSFEARERKFQQERLFRGESVDLIAKITTDGVSDNISGYAISGIYQPTDELSGPFYSLNAEIVDGKAILHWTDANDFGRSAYNVWGLLTKDGKAAYPICWRLMFAHSPSYPLSAIDPLVRTIDFSQYELLNAPWLELSDVQSVKEDVLLSVSEDFLALSGGRMDDGAVIRFAPEGDKSIQFSGNGMELVQEATPAVEAMSGWCFHSIPDPVPDYEIQWLTESEIANWDWSQGAPPWQNPRLRLCATKPGQPAQEEHVIASFGVPTDETGDLSVATRSWTQSNFESKEEAAKDHQTLSNDLTAWVEGQLPEPSGPLASLTINQNGQTLIEYHPDGGSPQEVTIVVPTKIKDLIGSDELVTEDGLSSILSDYATISALNDSFNNARSYTDEQITWLQSTLSDYAELSDVENLSATYETKTHAASTYQTKGDAVADATYLTERIDAVSAAISSIEVDGGMSACLSSAEFSEVEFLLYDENGDALSTNSITDIGNKINSIIALLKRVDDPHASSEARLTKIRYTDGTEQTLNLTGNVLTSDIPNINSVSAIVFGTNVTSLANQLFKDKLSLQEVVIPGTIASIPQQAFNYSYPNNVSKAVSAITLNEGTTTIANSAFYGCNFSQITIPSTVTSLEKHAFSYNYSLSSLIIPAAVTSIGEDLAANCFSLSSIDVDSENQNFKSADGLLLNKNGTILYMCPTGRSGSIVVPEGVVETKEGSLANLSNCVSLTLPSTLTTIGFAGLEGFFGWGFSTLTIPSSVTSIGQYGFSGAANKTITFEGKTTSQVRTMSNYPWARGSGTVFVCTDGTL